MIKHKHSKWISRAKFQAIAATTANGKPTFVQLGMNGAFRA